MTAEEPTSRKTGPSSPELEVLRVRLYAPGGASTHDVDAYQRLRSASESDRASPTSAREVRVGRPAGGRGRRAALPLVVALMIAGAVGGAALTARPTPGIDPPPLSGRSIAAYGRSAEPHVGRDDITYQPEGYTVFHARGRVVHIALRCIGSGSVTISAGSSQRFECADREEQFERSDGRPRWAPFMVIGRTTGDVVWGVRVTLRGR